MKPTKILVIDDEADIRDVLSITLGGEGYTVFEASDGEEGLKAVEKYNPDLIIVDYSMPKLDGRGVVLALKKDILVSHIPVIMLTGKSNIQDKVGGIAAGADDYIVKPFEPQELIARVQMIIRRTEQNLEANPLTRLPGNISILNQLQEKINSGKLFAVCYADLDKFKSYNDKYGFEHGDDVIKETARILIRATRAFGNPDDFIGHIGGDDLMIVTTLDKVDPICSAIVVEFDKTAPSFYNEEDRKNGYIVAKDRKGIEQRIPLLSISIGVVSNEKRKISHVAEVGEIGAELKKLAKNLERSNYIKDQRQT